MITREAIRRRDKNTILRELDAVCWQIASDYYLAGGGPEDLHSEAQWGLAKAVNDFRGDGVGHFLSFARMCIRRQVITAVKAATRCKHQPLNERVSMEASVTPPGRTGAPLTIGALLFSYASDPLRIVLAREAASELAARMERLTPWERECVERVLIGGETYEEVSASAGRKSKAVDNAMMRAKRKLAPVIELEPAERQHGLTAPRARPLAA